MQVESTKIRGLLLICPKVISDRRGEFPESFHQQRYWEAGIDLSFVQDNISLLVRKTILGLHLQSVHDRGKLVSVSWGKVYDVAIDLCPDSETYTQWPGDSLSQQNRRRLYIPPGFAYGFCVTNRTAELHYKCSEYYRPQSKHVVGWDVPGLALHGPTDDPILSEKDARALSLAEGAGTCRQSNSV